MKRYHSIGENVAIATLLEGTKPGDLGRLLGVSERSAYRYLKVVAKAKERVKEWGLQE